MENYKVYVLICPVENIVRYIGITKLSLKERLRHHCKEKGKTHKIHWIKSLQKQKKKPYIKMLYSKLSKEIACKKEIELIKEYREKKDARLTNIAKGGNIGPEVDNKGENNPMYGKVGSLKGKFGKDHPAFGRKHTKEAIEKMKKSFTKDRIEKLRKMSSGKNNPMYGKRLPEEILEKRRVSVIQLSKEGNMIKKFKSIIEASRETGVRSSGICSCCKGVYKSSGGFVWRYEHGK